MLAIRYQLALLGVIISSLAGYSLKLTIRPPVDMLVWRYFAGSLTVVLCLLAALVWHLFYLRPGTSHGWTSLLVHYLMYHVCPFLGDIQYTKLSKIAKDAKAHQAQLLMSIIHQQRNSAYGRDLGFSNIQSVDEFRSKHPLTSYAHYEPYVARVMEGEENVMFTEKVVHIGVSSGTSGASKKIPISKAAGNPSVGLLYMRTLQRRGRLPFGRVLGLRYTPKVLKSRGGVNVTSLTYYLGFYSPTYVTPRPAFDLTREGPALYAHALFGLLDEDVVVIDGLMSGLVASFFRLIENNWAELCRDIESGSVSPDQGIDQGIRQALAERMKPNPARARALRAEFQKGFQGIARRIWPRLRALHMHSTGGFAAQARIIRNCYAPDVLILTIAHGSSEGLIGLGLTADPADYRFTILPHVSFLEFIEEERIAEVQPPTKLLHELERDRRYEVVLTTACGLYRYRIGDVIRVVDYFHECPTYDFDYRVGQMLNLTSEKLPESVFYQALAEGVDGLGQGQGQVKLREYTAVENSIYEEICGKTTGLKYYVLFVELSKDGEEFLLQREQKLQFDKCLQRVFDLYRNLRESGSFSQMEVVQIRAGGFQALTDFMIQDSGNQQFKMPRALRNETFLRYLLQYQLL